MAPPGTVDVGGRDPFTTGLEGVTYLGLEWVLNPIVRSDIAVPELLKSVGGDHYPERRDELVRILDVDLSWHLHAGPQTGFYCFFSTDFYNAGLLPGYQLHAVLAGAAPFVAKGAATKKMSTNKPRSKNCREPLRSPG